MSLYREADAGHLAKLDEAERRGFSIDQINEMRDRLRPRGKRSVMDAARWEAERRALEERDATESIEAEESLWKGRMRGAAADRGADVWWTERPGIDGRVFDVSGMRSVS